MDGEMEEGIYTLPSPLLPSLRTYRHADNPLSRFHTTEHSTDDPFLRCGGTIVQPDGCVLLLE
jgi:hypothetical protein